MYKAYDQAVSITYFWVLTWSPESCWQSSHSLQGCQSRCCGFLAPGRAGTESVQSAPSLEMVPAMMAHVPAEGCWVTPQRHVSPRTEKWGSAASAFTCYKTQGKSET